MLEPHAWQNLCAFAVATMMGCPGGGSSSPAETQPRETSPVPPSVASTSPEPPAPAPSPSEVTCDPTGTWKISIHPNSGEDDCELEKENFNLALSFVREGGATLLASAGTSDNSGGAMARLLPQVRSALLVGQPACGVRVILGPKDKGSSPSAELLLSLEQDKLGGFGTFWSRLEGKACRQWLGVWGERAAGASAPLGETVLAPKLLEPRPATDEQAALVRKMSIQSLLRGKSKKPVIDYIEELVMVPGVVRLHDVACGGPNIPSERCIAVTGDACAPHSPYAAEDCEGMQMTVVMNPRTGQLDRADVAFPVRTQADVEAWVRVAP